MTRSDILVINKTDLAPYVGASLDVMEQDAARMRKGLPTYFTNLKARVGVAEVWAEIRQIGGLPSTG